MRQLFEAVLYNDLKTIENSFKLYNRPFLGPFEVFAAHFSYDKYKRRTKNLFHKECKMLKIFEISLDNLIDLHYSINNNVRNSI